jgi:cysteine synthase A
MEAQGTLKKGGVMVEPTSGNTGIALAFVAAARGYRLILTMPDSMSVERRKMLKLLGAEIELTPADKGMKGAIAKAEEIIASLPGAAMPSQFDNPANPDIHRKTTAEEIWKDTKGEFDVLVCGVGTGGTLTGCGEVFKSRNPNIRIVAVEPEDSPVLSGGEPGPHKIQGIGAGFVPSILKTELIDETISIANGGAGDRRAAGDEGRTDHRDHPLLRRALSFHGAVRRDHRLRTRAWRSPRSVCTATPGISFSTRSVRRGRSGFCSRGSW